MTTQTLENTKQQKPLRCRHFTEETGYWHESQMHKNKIKGITRYWLDLSKSLACTNSHVRRTVIAHSRMKSYLTSTLKDLNYEQYTSSAFSWKALEFVRLTGVLK